MTFDKSTPIAFFGATGGCTLAALVKALNSGARARALARTPSKLIDLLTTQGVSPDAITKRLSIVSGNAKDEKAVRKTLECVETGDLCQNIVFGIGGKPVFSPNPLKPTLDDPEVCQSTMRTLLLAISSIQYRSPPTLLAISTTGLSSKRDVPILFLPLYHWLLAIPHQDKKVMEDLVLEARSANLLGSYTLVRPSLLTDGSEKEDTKVRVGNDQEPKVGYTISRKDVGKWVWEQWGENGVGRDEKVTLSY
ncbi:hypothetical protein T439DRAFT_327058 [Meredithblackwellia eburnea MCA 4105]